MKAVMVFEKMKYYQAYEKKNDEYSKSQFVPEWF